MSLFVLLSFPMLIFQYFLSSSLNQPLFITFHCCIIKAVLCGSHIPEYVTGDLAILTCEAFQGRKLNQRLTKVLLFFTVIFLTFVFEKLKCKLTDRGILMMIEVWFNFLSHNPVMIPLLVKRVKYFNLEMWCFFPNVLSWLRTCGFH